MIACMYVIQLEFNKFYSVAVHVILLQPKKAQFQHNGDVTVTVPVSTLINFSDT